MNKYIIKYYHSATFLQNLNQQFDFIKGTRFPQLRYVVQKLLPVNILQTEKYYLPFTRPEKVNAINVSDLTYWR